MFLEVESIHDQSGQETGVSRIGDFDLSQHSSDDDFNVFVVDFNPLGSVDLLDLVQEVLLDGFFTAYAKDIVRYQWAFDQCLTGFDDIP
jgi:hypothetical protein